MNCLHCGAPLELSPDSVVVVCRYCGFANFIAGDAVEVFAVPTLSSGEILNKAMERTRRDFNLGPRINRINFAAPQLAYIPFYFVHVDMLATYSAKVVVTYEKTDYVDGKPNTRTESTTVYVTGEVHYDDVVGVLARRAAGGLSIDKLLKHFFKTAPPPAKVGDVATGVEVAKSFMSSEVTVKQAKTKAVRHVVKEILTLLDQDARRKAEARISGEKISSEVKDKTVDYQVKRLETSELTYLPLWIVPYFFENTAYRYYVAGWDGKVLVAEEPYFIEHKLVSALRAAAVGGVIGGIGLSALSSELILSAAALVVGGVLSYRYADELVKFRRYES